MSHCRPRAVSHSGAIFGPWRKRKGKQRKELLFSVDLGLEKIRRPAGPEKAVTVGPEDPGLKKSWQGAGVQGSQGRAQIGHLHLGLTNCSDMQRHRGTASWDPQPPPVAKHLE